MATIFYICHAVAMIFYIWAIFCIGTVVIFCDLFSKIARFFEKNEQCNGFFLRLHYVLHISVIWIRLLWDKMSGSFRVRQHSTYNIYYYFTNKLSSKFTKHKAVHAIFQTELSLIHKTVFSFIQFLDRHRS